jgi:tetratricopeptide (TPR) repeat protein
MEDWWLARDIPAGSYAHEVREAQKAWKLSRRSVALEYYNRAVELRASDAITLLNRGNLLLELGRPHEALSDLEAAERLDVNIPIAALGNLFLLRTVGCDDPVWQKLAAQRQDLSGEIGRKANR